VDWIDVAQDRVPWRAYFLWIVQSATTTEPEFFSRVYGEHSCGAGDVTKLDFICRLA
jgi:hypothetical protein